MTFSFVDVEMYAPEGRMDGSYGGLDLRSYHAGHRRD